MISLLTYVCDIMSQVCLVCPTLCSAQLTQIFLHNMSLTALGLSFPLHTKGLRGMGPRWTADVPAVGKTIMCETKLGTGTEGD